jgi:hypothetical protein
MHRYGKWIRLPNIDEIFKRRHCDQEIIILYVVCVGITGSISAMGSRGNDGRARDLSGARDNHARDWALRAGGPWRVA